MTEKFRCPAATVDLIVPYDGGIVLVKRKNDPYKGYWALPGGFLEYGKETLEEAAARELFEEAGLETKPSELRLIGVYSEPNRDPRAHVIAHAYEAKNYSGTLIAKDDAAEVRVFKNLPERLAFDHSKIIRDYFECKRREEKWMEN